MWTRAGGRRTWPGGRGPPGGWPGRWACPRCACWWPATWKPSRLAGLATVQVPRPGTAFLWPPPGRRGWCCGPRPAIWRRRRSRQLRRVARRSWTPGYLTPPRARQPAGSPAGGEAVPYSRDGRAGWPRFDLRVDFRPRPPGRDEAASGADPARRILADLRERGLTAQMSADETDPDVGMSWFVAPGEWEYGAWGLFALRGQVRAAGSRDG